MELPSGSLVEMQLFPFTLTRSVLDIRIGILTIGEKWLLRTGFNAPSGFPLHILPTKKVIDAFNEKQDVSSLSGVLRISRPWHIFQHNDIAIREDFELLKASRASHPLSISNRLICPENIFAEEGARAECCILNASTGPIYLGKNAEILEGSIIRGPFALCEGSTVKMGAKIYGATTIGPYSVAGGEIKNSVIFGYTNKAHDGYLGDSVLGEWCNLGAGTSNSNIKNNAADVKIYSPRDEPGNSPGQKCGVFMGDYCRTAINTSLNTGTVTGVCCNIYGGGLTQTYIPSFSWGGNAPVRYEFEKAMRDVRNWKKLKKGLLEDEEVKKLKDIFDNL